MGGNCATQLNDWSKIMRPIGVGRPVVTYPLNNTPIPTLTPTVTGTGIPGATVTLRVRDQIAPGVVLFTGTTTVDGSGNWSILVTTSLTEGHSYFFDSVQGIPGSCPVNPDPPRAARAALDTSTPLLRRRPW